ncbi:hypothetical protein OF83DRAFT_1063473 [Amylostereum chailletii]|nr:hypothetical protein OF83DRAFT_1063473 [Amylostereum chailletii]
MAKTSILNPFASVPFLLIQPVVAQAPANDIVSWPSGLLLLATVLYAALSTDPDALWEIEPTIGLFLFEGLPRMSISRMQSVNWFPPACHFVPGIRNAHGQRALWVCAELVGEQARAEALRKALQVLKCAMPRVPKSFVDQTMWKSTAEGLVRPSSFGSMQARSVPSPASPQPSARDFLLFAAIHYDVFWDHEIHVLAKGRLVFNTRGMPHESIIDAANEDEALLVVAASLARQPRTQSQLHKWMQNGLGYHVLDLDVVPRERLICTIDFGSNAPTSSAVSASLQHLAVAYLRVVRHIRHAHQNSNIGQGSIQRVHVEQTLWIAILGGVILDRGRLTIQELPGPRRSLGESTSDVYLTLITHLLDTISTHNSDFDSLASRGRDRRTAITTLLVGLFGQAVVCYFVSVGTSAGVWTSVALANSIFGGRLNDIHSVWYRGGAEQDGSLQGLGGDPGLKMYTPGSKDIMVIATFDRSAPRLGKLRPGFLLNALGLVAATLGAVFTAPTRAALQFGPITPTPQWVVYTSIVLCLGTSVLVTGTVVLQQMKEKTWRYDSETPTRWMVYSTLPASIVVCALAMFFAECGGARFWPVLDAVTWLSGFPLGIVENGAMFQADANVLHLVLLNRWMMGAVASSLGSSRLHSGVGRCGNMF